MELVLKVAGGVEEVGPQEWDRYGGGRPFSSYRWYRFGELACAEQRPVYLLFSRAGEPVARATLWRTSEEPLPIASARVRETVQAMIRRWPLLICRSPVADMGGLILPDGPERGPAIRAVIEGIKEQAQAHGASFSVLSYLLPEEAEEGAWEGAYFRTSAPNPGTLLDLGHESFEAYLGSLSKSVRKDYRRHRNRARDLGIEVRTRALTEPLDRETVDDAVRLIRQSEASQGSLPVPWVRGALRHAHEAEACWIEARIGERMVGCGMLFGDRGQRVMSLLGLDTSERYVYFQLFYAAVRAGIESDSVGLRGGSGTYQTKLRLGFSRQENNRILFSPKNALLRRLGQLALSHRHAPSAK